MKNINEKEQKFLCGVNPKHKDPIEDEDDINIDNGVLAILYVNSTSISRNSTHRPETMINTRIREKLELSKKRSDS